MTLPYAAQGAGQTLAWQESFGGLDRRLGAKDGAITAMENMTGDHWPVMSPRPARRKYAVISEPHGLGGADKLFWVSGTQFYYNGTAKGTVTAGDKHFACLGSYVVIWPDKRYYNAKTDEFGALEASVCASGAKLMSRSSPSGLSTERNCLHMPDCDLAGSFAPNEAVRLSGCGDAANNKTLVIREIDGAYLYFYDESFALPMTVRYDAADGLAVGQYRFYNAPGGMYYSFEVETAVPAGCSLILATDSLTIHVVTIDGTEQQTITAELGAWPEATELEVQEYCPPQTQSGTVSVAREVPALEHCFQCGNRLWGVAGNAIWCSYLGDPRVWYNFDQTATACWSVEAGSPGAFTAAYAYGGYPLFFKEDHIYRVYGTKSANFQLFDTQTLGVESGSAKSLAVVGQTLYYKTRAGFAAYAGGVPRLIDASLGVARRQDAVAGTDGRKYYVSCREGDAWSLLVYDAQLALWHREDDSRAMDMAWCGGELYMLRPDGGLWMLGRVRSTAGQSEDVFESGCELAPMVGSGGGYDAVTRLYFRVSADGTLTAEVEYDGSGVWEKLTAIESRSRRMKTVELVPRRCGEFRIRLRGRGDWKLWALGREYAPGSRKEGGA